MLAVSMLGLALSTAACSESAASNDGVATAATAGKAGGSPSPTPSLSLEQRLRQWAACMRAEGLDMPDPARNADSKISVEPPAGTQKGYPAVRAARLAPTEALATP
jgi:hypothetical protein